jgi:hypothetical protein
MVFQTNAEYGARSFLNGKARPGEHVNVKFTPGGVFPAVADTKGDWEVQFNGGGVGHGPGTVTVTGEDGPPIVAENVMGGDVYFCSGQVGASCLSIYPDWLVACAALHALTCR